MSLVRLHEQGFGVPVGRFMRALCEYYGVELHNFSPNSISQAAVLEQLVADRLLPVNINLEHLAWIPSRPEETEPNPPRSTL